MLKTLLSNPYNVATQSFDISAPQGLILSGNRLCQCLQKSTLHAQEMEYNKIQYPDNLKGLNKNCVKKLACQLVYKILRNNLGMQCISLFSGL